MPVKKILKSYHPKNLIDGASIDQQAGTSWVAIPDKFAGKQFVVVYSDTRMTIKDWRKEAQMFKRFRDKYWTINSNRKQYYTLGYFKFRPDNE